MCKEGGEYLVDGQDLAGLEVGEVLVDGQLGVLEAVLLGEIETQVLRGRREKKNTRDERAPWMIFLFVLREDLVAIVVHDRPDHIYLVRLQRAQHVRRIRRQIHHLLRPP